MALGSELLTYVGAIIRIFVFGFILVVVLGGVYWWWLKRNRKAWHARIYEPDQTGLPGRKNREGEVTIPDNDIQRLRMLGFDRVVERTDQHGNIRYELEKRKTAIMPPSYEYIETSSGKLYVDLLLKEGEYTYMAKGITSDEIVKHHVMHYNTKTFTSMNVEERKKRYAKSADFIQKWGHLLSIALIVVLLIATMALTFDFVNGTIKEMKGETERQITFMEQLLQKVAENPPDQKSQTIKVS